LGNWSLNPASGNVFVANEIAIKTKQVQPVEKLLINFYDLSGILAIFHKNDPDFPRPQDWDRDKGVGVDTNHK